ncbi:hypothetical protein [Rubrivirga sp.]|uniref:hypothetical protein n=1 Tax=Rubrivirga sp. TaxID=1885344 RepID=UPI003B52F330
MSTWSQVFDDDRVLEEARQRTRRNVVAFALVSGALVSLAPLATLSPRLDPAAVALLCGALLSLGAGAVMVRLAREYRRLWRIELCVGRFVGHDAAGRRRTLAWSGVDRVDVSAAGLTVTGRDESGRGVRLTVAAAMPSFTVLAHRAVEYAEAHGRTVSVGGTPLADLDLVELFPTLCESVGTAA